MTVSKDTIDTVHAQLTAKPVTYTDLAKLTGLSVSSVRLAVSNLITQNRAIVLRGRPVMIKALKNQVPVGQTLIIREPAPPLEIDQSMIEKIKVAMTRDESDPMLSVLFERMNGNEPDRLSNLLAVLVNCSEVIRQKLESLNALDPSDVVTE